MLVYQRISHLIFLTEKFYQFISVLSVGLMPPSSSVLTNHILFYISYDIYIYNHEQ